MEAIEDALLVVQAEQKKELQQQLEEGLKSIQELITLTLQERLEPRRQASTPYTPEIQLTPQPLDHPPIDPYRGRRGSRDYDRDYADRETEQRPAKPKFPGLRIEPFH
jgi:hypothetical protein